MDLPLFLTLTLPRGQIIAVKTEDWEGDGWLKSFMRENQPTIPLLKEGDTDEAFASLTDALGPSPTEKLRRNSTRSTSSLASGGRSRSQRTASQRLLIEDADEMSRQLPHLKSTTDDVGTLAQKRRKARTKVTAAVRFSGKADRDDGSASSGSGITPTSTSTGTLGQSGSVPSSPAPRETRSDSDPRPPPSASPVSRSSTRDLRSAIGSRLTSAQTHPSALDLGKQSSQDSQDTPPGPPLRTVRGVRHSPLYSARRFCPYLFVFGQCLRDLNAFVGCFLRGPDRSLLDTQGVSTFLSALPTSIPHRSRFRC